MNVDDFWHKLQEEEGLPDNIATSEEDFWNRVKEEAWYPTAIKGTIPSRGLELTRDDLLKL